MLPHHGGGPGAGSSSASAHDSGSSDTLHTPFHAHIVYRPVKKTHTSRNVQAAAHSGGQLD